MSTNKVYEDNPNQLPLVKKKTRFEIRKKSQYFRGIKENFPIDNCTHSFFGVSKTYADLIVQEYGKNVGLKLYVSELDALQDLNIAVLNFMGFYLIL